MPLVTVLLPIRNGATTLARALESVQAQTLSDWELVAVDDGSTDATPAMLAAAAAADPRIRVATTPPLGLVAALNHGLALARGAFIARLDADDVCHPERLGRQVAALRADAALGLVGCQVAFGGDASRAAGYALHVAWLNELLTPAAIARERFIEAPFAHPSVMFRRDLIAAHGGYAEGPFPEDYELWLRWLEAGVRMAKLPEVLLTWHDSPGRLSRTSSRYAPEAFYALKARYLARELHRRGVTAPWVWGAGRPTRRRAGLLEAEGLRVAGFIDIDPRKIGRLLPGDRRVVAPADVPAPDTAFVLGYVAKRGARELARVELGRRGYIEGVHFLLCA